jgi:small subunit ribosomal protein S20
MPNIKSSKKSVRTDKIKTKSNTSYLSRVKNGIKKLEKAVKANDKETANTVLKTTLANIDKCASKGLMKQNTCDRQKSRLNKKVKEMS